MGVLAEGTSLLTIYATKPNGKVAVLLADMGIRVLPLEEDEGNVDRYVLSKRVAVERRTSASLLQGIQDKTLFTSAIYLREHSDAPILIVEGQPDYERTSFSPQAVRGALSALLLSYGMNVLATSTIEETVGFIAMAARHQQAGIPEISLVPKRKAASVTDMQRRVVEMLPECGMATARQLLQHFGSVQRIAIATEEELRGVRGIGAKKATRIHAVMNREYGAVDTERDLEDAIEATPSLLFDQPVVLLARQHQIRASHGERLAIDLVFLDAEANELLLVELKRGALEAAHCLQIRRYLDHAYQSRLLAPFLAQGARLRGILVSVVASQFVPADDDVSVRIVDEREVIAALKQLRDRRLTREANRRQVTQPD